MIKKMNVLFLFIAGLSLTFSQFSGLDILGCDEDLMGKTFIAHGTHTSEGQSFGSEGHKLGKTQNSDAAWPLEPFVQEHQCHLGHCSFSPIIYLTKFETVSYLFDVTISPSFVFFQDNLVPIEGRPPIYS